MRLQMRLNGQPVSLEVSPTEPLLHVLRERFHLLGSKESCGKGECGSCSVILNGRVVNSCLVMAAQADGLEVVTIEGLVGPGGTPLPIQQAFVDAGAVQCGYCTPGMVMSAYALLQENPHPTEQEVVEGMAGNLCRCTGYQKIFAAVTLAAKGAPPWPE